MENPLKGKRISQLKIDSIRNVNKNYCLMDMQLMNEKKMILTFGINNASMVLYLLYYYIIYYIILYLYLINKI